MDLKELVDKPVEEMTDDELEQSIQMLSKLKISREAAPSGVRKQKSIKSNKDKAKDNLLANLTPEQMEKLKAILGGL